MSEWYDGHIQLDPALPLEQSVKALPARWAVYLMSDADDRPVQLLCVRNLRASVKRRLTYSGEELSKRVDYRGLVRHLRWKRVDGALESDLAYLDVARAVFPSGYRQMVTLRPTWWLHVDPAATFPRWTRSESPLAPAGSSPEHVAVGPLQEKGQAQRLIEMLEDGFDLCRYHHLLVRSPDAAACPYKDMGKCPAPCDGSVSMQQYRNLIAWSRDTLIDPADEIETQTERMREAAGELRFELAAKIKQFVDLLKSLRTGDNRFVRPFERFAFVAVQPAPSGQQAKLLLCTPAGTTELAGLISEPVEVLRHLTIPTDPRPIDLERLCILTHHLFQPKTGACFVPLDQLSDQTLRQAYRAACRQPSDGESDDEGIVREAAVVG